jgi:ADP-heptose:LPS heptosyltransferase
MENILFIELLGGLGDVLIALPAIQALSASYPQAQMTVLTFAPGNVLLQHHPLIQQVIKAPKGQARQAVEKVLQTPYDLVVTDTTYEGIAELVQQSHAGQTVTNLWCSPPPDQLVGDRMLQILRTKSLITPAAAKAHRHPQIHLSDEEHRRVQVQLGTIGHPRIGLYPDAGMVIKQWSPDHFVALGQMLQERYGATLIVPEGANRHQVETIVNQLGGATLWPRGSLRELAALFAQLDCVVAADTGPARIAAAVGTPTVTLFGPSWQGRYGQPDPHINLQGYPPCPERNLANFTEQICWYSGSCPFAWDTCVNLIAPERVAAAVGEILAQGRGGPGAGCGVPGIRSQDVSSGEEGDRVPGIRSQGVSSEEGCRVPGIWSQDVSSNENPIPKTQYPTFIHPSTCQNLLVMRLDNIGDVIMTSPALRAIKETNPDIRLTLMASPAGALTKPLLPWVDEVIPWRTLWQALGKPPGDVEQEWELIETLKSRQFDGAIILTSFKQSPHPPAFICQMAGIPMRLGASKETGECLTHRIADIPDDLHQAERNLRLVEAAGFPGQDGSKPGQKGDRNLWLCIPPSSHLPTSPYLLLNPWTSCPSRMYDLQRFAIAARTLAEKTGYSIVLTGTDKNRQDAAPLLEILGSHAIDLIGKTSLSDLVALVAHAELMLSNNTSTMHIADATQTPSVILFAGTELERQWRPRQTRAHLLRRPTPCSPCYAFDCPYDLECLDIPPEEVVQAGLDLLH